MFLQGPTIARSGDGNVSQRCCAGRYRARALFRRLRLQRRIDGARNNRLRIDPESYAVAGSRAYARVIGLFGANYHKTVIASAYRCGPGSRNAHDSSRCSDRSSSPPAPAQRFNIANPEPRNPAIKRCVDKPPAAHKAHEHFRVDAQHTLRLSCI